MYLDVCCMIRNGKRHKEKTDGSDLMKTWKNILTASVLILSFSCPAFAADGTWTLTDQGYRYVRQDGTQARGTWEDIDGEWYHFNETGIMDTGWRTISNIRYHFNSDGSLSEGWQYDESGGGNWYYYDPSGNAVTRWFLDQGNWYWFDADGKMNREAVRTIEGKTYAFRQDGSMRVNEYDGFSYTDFYGQPDHEKDILAAEKDGTPISVGEETKKEIAGYVNAFPDGWRKKFVDDGWKFVYCPSEDAYRTFCDKSGNVQYSCFYTVDDAKKELRFSKAWAVKDGFGAYLYEHSGDEIKRDQFPKNARYRFDAICKATGVPEAARREYEVLFGALFHVFQSGDAWNDFKEQAPDAAWTVERAAKNRSADGRLDLE